MPADAGLAHIATCCLREMTDIFRDNPARFQLAKIKFHYLECKKAEHGGIMQDQHHLRIDCERVSPCSI
jgi:hypothetical protein